jgi:hypothetical protein
MRIAMNVKNCVLPSAVLAAVLMPCIASAALGEAEVSVQADAAQLRGSIKVTERTNYRLHEIQLPSGTLVHEFAGPDGTVFAVAWSGPTQPNFRQTLGRYFDNYVTAAKARHGGLHRLEIQQSDLVVQAGGHMRAFSGRAYLPQSVPAGVSLGDLR